MPATRASGGPSAPTSTSALAAWLEAVAGDRVAEVGGEIGRHYADALEAAPALALLLGGLEHGTVAALARAGSRPPPTATSRGSRPPAAAEGYRRAIALTPAADRLALAGLRRRLAEAIAADDLDRAVDA